MFRIFEFFRNQFIPGKLQETVDIYFNIHFVHIQILNLTYGKNAIYKLLIKLYFNEIQICEYKIIGHSSELSTKFKYCQQQN